MFDVFYYGTKPNRFAHERPADSLEDAASKSHTRLYWYIYGGNDYTDFDFNFIPAPWEEDHIHIFPSQWQKTGGVYLANRHTVNNKEWHFHNTPVVTRLEDRSRWDIPANIDDSEFDYSWHPNELEPDYEHHFPTQWQGDGGPVYRGTAGKKFQGGQYIRSGTTQIFYMDFMNPDSQPQFARLQAKHPTIKLTRYVDNHLNVFKRIVNLATTEFVWITSSICNYADFDFTWHPHPDQREMVHVFGDTTQPRGDTFYIHIPSFRAQLYELELLDWFNVINYCKEQSVNRFDPPVVTYNQDSIVPAVMEYQFDFPYAVFTRPEDIVSISIAPCLWHAKDREVTAITRSGSTSIVPREIKAYLQTQIYDYPYVRRDKSRFVTELELDVIYISNGEPNEQLYYDRLCHVLNYQVIWIRGVNGRTAAYQAAAQASRTPWFFAVFAKLYVVDDDFLWYTWRPDYWQEPKHYIFNALNPVNGLEYGHQGMIAYNKQLVLANNSPGLDFTLSQPHESVPILSGTAAFNQSEWMTWRTAFREVLKLKHFMAIQPTVETEHRLRTWSTVARGDYAEWCLRGAADAVVYYDLVGGDYEQLKSISFEWQSLRALFDQKTL